MFIGNKIDSVIIKVQCLEIEAITSSLVEESKVVEEWKIIITVRESSLLANFI